MSTKLLRILGSVLALVITISFAAGCGEKTEDGGTEKGDAAEQKSDESAAAGSATPYPLEVCIVSDEELGSMGEPVVKVYDGQEVKFCCESCVKSFEDDKASYLAKLKK
ncbi:MAG: hypothetical protein RL885_05845 [Planctomycetota bacterium]